MRIRILILLIFSLLMFATTKISGPVAKREFVESVATFVCPAKNGDTSGSIQLGKSGVLAAPIEKKNRELKKSKSRVLPLTSKARVVAGESPTPLLLSAKSGTWLALSQCSSSAGEFWFIGGTADVSSLGYFQFTNENLGKAIIDVELWSEDGNESTRTLTIPPRSTKNYSLTTFMPGKKLTAFHLLSRSGLVSVALFDERRKGLTAYGGDYIAPNPPPSKKVLIAGIPGVKFVKKSKITSQRIRLFVPGESDAVIQVNYISPTGVFAPVGLDSLRVPAQKVVEVDLSDLPSDRLFALQVLASEPVIASVLTRGMFNNQRELVWSSSVEATRGEVMALAERSGYLSIVSNAPEVSFTVVKDRGKKSVVTLPIDAMAIWKVPDTVHEIQFKATAEPTYLALAIKSISGVATTSLAPAQSKELTALPVLDSTLYIPATR